MGDNYQYITTEYMDEGSIVRVMLNRPEFRNAQNRGLLVELDDALLTAEADDQVKVVILGGVGPTFSAGHDLGTPDQRRERTPGPDMHPTWAAYGGTKLGAEQRARQEWHFFFANTLRWRNLRKVTIAQVQGQCYSAGLMLAWACDFIVASKDAQFTDVVGTRLGMCGLEYFAHPWEFGARRAKELLMTGDSIGAEEAHRLGMVSKVFENETLTDDTLAFARRIALLPSVTALMIKESVNQTVDNQGFYNALQSCFTLHQLNHAHWGEVTSGEFAIGTPEFGVPDWRKAPAIAEADYRRP